ncbi:MAG: class I SAM-dependent methyltransferase, partial [Pseudomonadota bacterium]|nr:class I SAM-dependent methyltransferase [Pseudomonadota bacterium]
MSDVALREKAQELLNHADVRIDGNRPWDLRVHDQRVFARAFAHGSLGLGEAYMDAWWDADDLDGFFFRVLDARLDDQLRNFGALRAHLKARFINLQRGRRAFVIGKAHYDLGNDLFEAMLGKRLVYSCGYWKDADNLDDAQEAKLDLICRKLGLAPGMRLLDVGCGWGSLILYAAENYGVRATGVTLSNQQREFVAKRIAERNLGDRVEVRLQDYRDVNDPVFDAVSSIEMGEHVGQDQYPVYAATLFRALRPGGRLLLQQMSRRADAAPGGGAFIENYIAPDMHMRPLP